MHCIIILSLDANWPVYLASSLYERVGGKVGPEFSPSLQQVLTKLPATLDSFSYSSKILCFWIDGWRYKGIRLFMGEIGGTDYVEKGNGYSANAINPAFRNSCICG
jgi:hypothetical protein